MRQITNSVVSVLFLMVYGMVLLHSVLTHHHHTNDQKAEHNHFSHSEHHDHDHHHSEHEDNNGKSDFPDDWSHPFSGQDHLEQITFNQSSFSLEIQQVASMPSAIMQPLVTLLFDEQCIAHQVDRPPILYEPPGSSSDPQRGPPSLV